MTSLWMFSSKFTSSGKVGQDQTKPEGHGYGQTGVRWLNWMAHSPASSGLQARKGGNMLGSRPSLVNVPMQLPGSWQHPSSETGTIGLGDDRVRLVQSGHSSRGSHAPPGRR
jgi:hypothetical protein